MPSLTPTGVTLLLAVLLTGCGAESGPTGENQPALSANVDRTPVHSSSVTPLDEIYFPSPCNGEGIHMIGTLSTEQTLSGTGDGVHLELQVVVHETGTGLTTGAAYRSDDVNHESWSAPTPEALFRTQTEHESYYFMSPTPGLSFRAHYFTHFVMQPSGSFKTTREVASLECRA